MRTIYLGTSEFAAEILTALAGSNHSPELVVTRPDRPAGRGRKMHSPPVFGRARDLGIEVIQPERLHDEEILKKFADVDPDAIVVCAYGVMIKEPLLSGYEIVNVHPSLVPRWRGAAPIERSIMAGDKVTGISIIRLTAGLDSGPIFTRQEVEVEPYDSYGTLAKRLEMVGSSKLLAVLDDLTEPEEQTDIGLTYAEKITAEDRLVDPTKSAQELHNQIRGLSPHIGARLPLGDGYLGVWECEPVELTMAAEIGSIEIVDGEPILICADGGLRLIEVQPAGRQRMAAGDWLRGQPEPR